MIDTVSKNGRELMYLKVISNYNQEYIALQKKNHQLVESDMVAGWRINNRDGGER